MDLCHVPPTINAILQNMNKLHESNEETISLLVKILVKFHLLHTDLKLQTEQNFYNAYRKRAKLWVISCLSSLMKPNVDTSIASIDALITDAFQHEGILDLDTMERNVLEIINHRILYENKGGRSMSTSLTLCDGDDLSNDIMGLVSSQLESFQNEQGLDSTSLVDLVLNE